MHIAICDNNPHSLSALSEKITLWKTKRGITTALVHDFLSSEDLLYSWEKGRHYDIMILETKIPFEVSGLEIAKRIRAKDQQCIIIFVTAFTEYVFEGYSVDALRYLIKPVQYCAIAEALDTAYDRWLSWEGTMFTWSSKKNWIGLPHRNIVYVETQGHKLILHLAHSEEQILIIRATLAEIASKLPQNNFVQIYRSYIVNLFYVHSFSCQRLLLANNIDLPISTAYFPELKSRFDALHEVKK